ncbi:MAG: class I SAM-dependent methyltransferase [Pseudomonadota bacterium]
MTAWQRVASFGGMPESRSDETWIYEPDIGPAQKFPVHVTNGKPFNVLGLKGADLDEIRKYAAHLRRTAKQLYGPGIPRRRVETCPCCLMATAGNTVDEHCFIGVTYHRCTNCAHGFVLEQPTEEALNAVFENSTAHASAYVNHDSLEARMREIISPKVNWTLSTYREVYSTTPKTGVDVGAGGGHFVEGMRRAGIDAAGYELNRSSRQFAKEAFGLDLRKEDFLKIGSDPVDLVAFWGMLEYAPEPRRFLEVARRQLIHGKGLLVVEVPRFDCLGTAVQMENPFNIARHMDPTSHINTFSDASLATALVETGFRPVAAWYFGMDVYEFLIQAALRLDDGAVIEKLADMIPTLQAGLDQSRQCDDLVVAAVPMK